MIQSEASILLLVLLISQILSKKRCSVLFLWHTLLPILIIARNVLRCFQFSKIYDHFRPNRPDAFTGSYTLWITSDVLAFLILLCTKASLYIHACAACVTLRKLYRQLFLGLSACITVLAIGFRLAFYIEDFRNGTPSIRSFSFGWLIRTSNLLASIDICWLCAIVGTKLGFSLHFKSKHGSGRFSPMHVIVIICCQTFVILGLSHIS